MLGLVSSEDLYGVTDILNMAFFGEKLDYLSRWSESKDWVIAFGRSSGNVFVVEETWAYKPTDIIFVYDMDKLGGKSATGDRILSVDALVSRIKNAKKAMHEDCTMWFAPVLFAAETLCLHKFTPNDIDFSMLFSIKNTAHLHTKMLRDLLSDKFPKDAYNSWWGYNSMSGASVFNEKKTHNYIAEGMTLRACYNILQERKFARYNKELFSWLISEDINTFKDHLLTADQAIQRQSDICTEYQKCKSQIQAGCSEFIYRGIPYSLAEETLPKRPPKALEALTLDVPWEKDTL